MSILRYLEPILLVLPALALAAKPLGHEICVAACVDASKGIAFTDQSGGDGTSCLNNLRISSTYACVRVRCEDQDIGPGMAWWQKQCKHSNSVVSVAQYHSTMDNISLGFLGSLPSFAYEDERVFDEIVVPSNDTWGLVYGTVYEYNFQRHLHNTLRWIPYAFWALVLVILTGHRVLASTDTWLFPIDAIPAEHRDRKADSSHQTFHTWSSAFQSHIVLAPAFNRRMARSFGWLTGGTRLQSLTILCYIIIHIAIISVRYPTMERNFYYDSREIQRLRYVSDRIGVLMSSSLPFIWLFGTRNNFFLWATGLSFSTMQIFHRWVSLVFSIEAIIHGSCFTAYYLQQTGVQGYKLELRDPLFVCGILATTTAWTMILLSWRQILRSFYEFFKITHILLSIVLLVAYHKHVVSQFRGTYLVFLWICVGLWCFDHASRIMRLIIVNWANRTERGISTLAHATYSPGTDIIRLTMPDARNTPGRPGAYYFLSLPGSSWRIWEQHPFSPIPICTTTPSVTTPIGLSSFSPEQAKEADTTALPLQSPNSSATSKSCGAAGISFLIRPKSGMTARLRTRLLASSPPSTSLHVLLEGPYGTHPLPLFDPFRFSSILLVAGGTGITAIIPYLQFIIETYQHSDVSANGVTKRVNLVWIARESEFIRDVLRHELQLIFQVTNNQHPRTGLNLEIRLFATQQQQSPGTKAQTILSGSPSTSERSSNSSLPAPVLQVSEKGTDVGIEKDAMIDTTHHDRRTEPAGAHITFARPDISQLISAFCTAGSFPTSSRSLAETKVPTNSRTAVFVCGPMQLAEEARHVARQRTRSRVEYFEEVYGW